MGVLFKNNDSIIALEPDDYQELKTRVFSVFGWPTVNVEINDAGFQYIIKRAVSYLNIYAPKATVVTKSVAAHVSDYTISEYTQVNSLLDIMVSTEYLIGLGIPIQALMGVPMSIVATYNITQIENYMSMFQAYDMAKRMYGTQPIAELIHPNIVRVMPAPYMNSIFKFAITIDHDTNLASLNEYEQNWLVRFCQASTGKVLGEIRRKYDGVTLPVGSLSTSGNSIYTENLQNEKDLLEELKSRKKFPQAFITVG